MPTIDYRNAAASLAVLAFVLASGSAAAQTQPTQVAAADPAPLNEAEMIVTGTRGVARTVAESPTPIDVISAPELERTGRFGTIAALNLLVPSFNAPQRAGGGTSTIIQTGGLRGLNPDQTLILVNGKRRHKTSLINAVSALYNGAVPVDLDLIPQSAIGRVEVLRDGAAAQYGSDAIAGVINFILKSDREGGQINFSAGQNFDRSDGENYILNANIGTSLGDRGFLDLFLSARQQELSNRAVPISPNINLYRTVNGQRDPREATIDRLVTTQFGNFPVRGFNVGHNLEYDFGGVELYSFGTFSQRRSDLTQTFRAPNNAASLPEVYPNGLRPTLLIQEEDFELAVGLRGQVSGWDWDLSSVYGQNRARQSAYDSINASLGPTSPTEFSVGALRSNEWINSLDFTRSFEVGSGKLQVSTGLQHRRERYAVSEGQLESYQAGNYTYVANGVTIRPAPGAQGASGFTPADAGSLSRNNLSAYVDLAWDPTTRTTISGALRYEHYDDASRDTLIGKITARQELTDWISVRGAVSTGFRAPSVAQQLYASTTGQFRTVNGVLDLLQIKTLPVNSPSAIALGAIPLQPEESTNFSLGVVLTPLAALTITIDGYQIDVRDRITITSTLTGAAVSAILVANGLSPEISGQYYANAIDTRTRGLDIVATYRHNLGSDGEMAWNIGYNYNQTDIRRIADNPSQLQSLGAGFVLFDRRAQSNLTTNLPRTKLLIANFTRIGDWSLNTRVNRFGRFDSFQNATATVGGQPVFG
ncbi:TonB-dependent receptor plug domain-containing protein [Polymorphobacter multimanifer]|uniref:Iron complex outermembrane receptor protein n=1 Tax=Polymorphobacter multimanifer TaxID=1070431 RepID=A0A841LAT4_9SPHN|nr:TonB-dependent receptor [Polymorphobacter multimanifer]MBB6228761.1 iron complex outermembrane receptor protein [Polymorphobacter multimanifer]